MILQLLLYTLLWSFDFKGPEATEKYNNESEVKTMTMDELKQKLLDKIDSMLEAADAENLRKLSEAYSLLHKDALMEKMTESRNSLFTGICNCEAGTVEKEEDHD